MYRMIYKLIDNIPPVWIKILKDANIICNDMYILDASLLTTKFHSFLDTIQTIDVRPVKIIYEWILDNNSKKPVKAIERWNQDLQTDDIEVN